MCKVELNDDFESTRRWLLLKLSPVMDKKYLRIHKLDEVKLQEYVEKNIKSKE